VNQELDIRHVSRAEGRHSIEWLVPTCRHDAAVLFAKLNLDGQFHSAKGFVLPDAQIYLPRLSGHEIHRGGFVGLVAPSPRGLKP
jgi:hypothetical protein